MDDYHLYWFSGSGNTLYIAEKAAELLEKASFHVELHPLEKTDPREISRSGTIGLFVPVAGQGTFPNVWEFLQALPDAEGTPFFLVDTMGYYSGGIKGPVKKIISRKGYRPAGALELVMPNTFLKKKTVVEKEKKIVMKGESRLAFFMEKLIAGRAAWADIPLYSDWMSSFYKTRKQSRKWIKMFRKSINSNCTECGICVKICPEKCYSAGDRHIDVNSENCVLCQRCLEYCPVNAIEMNGKKYIRNGRISCGEMLRHLGGK